jgi:polysaccharide biosynthesis transport protein
VIQKNLSPAIVETEPGYGQLFAILFRRLPWFIGALLASMAIASFINSKAQPTFQSSSKLLVEPNYQGNPQDVGPEKQFIDPKVQVDTATQLDLMRSSKLLQGAVDQLDVKYPGIKLDDIRRSLVVTQVKQKEDNVATKIFKIEYTDKSPEKAQTILQTIQQVYLDYNKDQQKERLNKGLQVINIQLTEVQSQLTKAEADLQKFRKEKNLIDPQSQATGLSQALGNIQQEQRMTGSQIQEAKARFLSLQQQLQTTPQKALASARITQSPRVQTLQAEIQKTDLELAKLRQKYTDEAPNVRELLQQRETQAQLLQQELGKTLQGEPQSGASAEGTEKQLSQVDINLAGELVAAQTAMQSLEAKSQELARKEQEINNQLKQFPLLLQEYNRLEPSVSKTRERLQELTKAKQNLSQELSQGGFDWQVVEKPQPGNQVSPNSQQNLLLGGVVGLILGGIAVALREASDDSVHTTAELEKQLSLPLLGSTPKLGTARNKEGFINLLSGKQEVPSPWAAQLLQTYPRWESLDLIYKKIELTDSFANIKSLMITSAVPDSEKSTLALGLAMSASRLHKRVLLIDANLRNPNLHIQLNLPNEQGLSSLLGTDGTLPDRINIQSSGSSHIDILTAGPIPGDPANLLSSPRMGELMAAFEQSYDLVIVDAPPVLGLVDAMLTASFCRSVVIVAHVGKVTRSQLTEATAMLSNLNLIGVVASGVSDSNASYVPFKAQQRLALQQATEK